MKLKALLLVLAVAGLAASFGLTATGRSDTGTTTGTTTTTTASTTTTTSNGDCRPFLLTGAFGSVSASSFTITPIEGRREKAKTAPAGTPVTVALTQSTHVFWQAKGTLAGPGVGDIARVFGKKCGSTYTAWSVRVRVAKGSDDGANDGSGEQKKGSDEQPKATEGHSRPKR